MKPTLLLTLAIVALAAAVFALDLLVPSRAACGTLYIAVVLVALRLPRREHVIVTAVFCSMLILSGAMIPMIADLRLGATNVVGGSPDSPPQLIANAVFELFAVWVATVFAYRKRGLEQLLLVANRDLEERVERRSAQLLEAAATLQTEIDQRKRAQRALGHSEAHYLSMIENLPIHVLRKDADGRFTFASPSFCQLVGRSADDILDKTDFDLYPAELAEKYRADDLRVIERGAVINDVEMNQLADGSKTYVQIIKMPITNPGGVVKGIQCIFWDVTTRMQAEDELRESEGRKRAIFETAVDCILFLDDCGRVVEANRAALKTFSCTFDDIKGQELATVFVSAESREQFREGLASDAAVGEVSSILGRRVEWRMKRKGGEEFIAEVATQPIPIAGSAGFAIFLRDITNRKRSEEALRTAKDAAESASRAKSMFVANMSHEIRTPMNAITGIADLLSTTPLSDTQQEHVSTLQQSADSLLDVLNDILDFSKIEAGKLDIDAHDYDLPEHIGDVIKSMAVRAQAKGLELSSHIADNVPRLVSGDDHRLRQVLVNLVGNAVKFTSVGEIVVSVSLQERSPSNALIQFSVRDTGIGIPQQARDKIFSAFEQADNSSTRRFGGTGLGLAISARLVELMEGSMWLESEVDRGSTFYFTTRVRIPDSNSLQSPSNQDGSLAHVRALAVNGDDASQLSRMLDEWSTRTEFVRGVEEAKQAVLRAENDDDAFELFLLDARAADVFSLAEWLRTTRPHLVQRIVVLVADDAEAAATCARLGLRTCASAPLSQSALFNAIAAATQKVDTEPQSSPKATDRLPNLKILLAEDSLVNQRLATSLLRTDGHEVDVANNGQEAVEAVTNRDYDLVLMDIQMPEVDGLQAATMIRARERTSGGHLPIVAVTAHAMKGDREACLAAGMDDYLAKPIRAAALFAKIRDVLKLPSSEPATERANTRDAGGNSDEGLLDWSHALDVVQGDKNLLAEVVEAYLGECPGLLSNMRASLDNRDREGLERAAHTFKGSMRYFGAKTAFRIALDLEEAGAAGRFDDAPQLLESLTQQAEKLDPLLVAFTQTGEMAAEPANS